MTLAAMVVVVVVAVAILPHCDFNCVKVTKMNHHKSEHIPMFISIMCHIRIANARMKITQKHKKNPLVMVEGERERVRAEEE